MGRCAILIILFNILAMLGISQGPINFRQADSATYAAYMAGDWKEVIRTGKLALEEDIDYHYLRLRMGIAYYNRHNYRAAARQLFFADKFNPGSAVTKEYSYYSYLFAGRFDEAYFAAGKMGKRILEITGIPKPSFFSLLYLEAGPEFSDNFEQNSLGQMPRGLNQQWQDLYGNSIYGQVGVKMNLHPRIRLYMGYSYLAIDKKAELQYLWNEPDSVVQHAFGFSKFFPSEQKSDYQQYEYTLRQNGFYLKTDLFLGRGFSLSPAIHFVNVNTKSVAISDNSKTVMDTANYFQPLNSVQYLYYTRKEFSLEAADLVLNNVVLSLGINKQLGIFDLGLFGSWSNLNDVSQVQFGFRAAYFPLGNLNLYGATTVKGITTDVDTWPVLGQVIGFRTFSFLWAEAYGVFGNLSGTNESDAFIVYNISDEINLKTGLVLTFVVSPSVQLSARYQYLQKTSSRYVSSSEGIQGWSIQEIDYTNQSILGGLKWTF